MNENKDNMSDNQELKKKLLSLYYYLAKHLSVKESPKLILTKSEKNAESPFGLTGYYDDKNKTIRIYITNRHDTDICRSFAHEIIHHWQNENGRLHNEKSQKNMTPAHYAQNDEHLRHKEYEAFLYGSILLRDWQDFNRYGPPKKDPQLPKIVD
jgi:hypothetical protein